MDYGNSHTGRLPLKRFIEMQLIKDRRKAKKDLIANTRMAAAALMLTAFYPS
jgi:hypothetical protein